MTYLSKAEQAMLTSTAAAGSGVVSAAAGIGLGIVIGTAANTVFAYATNNKLETMRGDIRNYAGKNFATAMKFSQKGISEGITELFNEIDSGFRDIIGLTQDGQWASVGGMFASLRDTWRGTSLLMASYNGIVQSIGIDPYITRHVNRNVLPNIINVNWAWYLHHIGKFTDANYHQMMSENGWSTSWTDAIEYANLSTLPIDALLDLKRRNKITDAEFNFQMKRAKFDATQIGLVNNLKEVVPEPYRAADMFSKGIVNQQRMIDAFSWYGINSEWANQFGEAAYNVPSLSIIFELLWRGLINNATFNLLISRSGLRKEVQDKIINLTELIPPSNDIITMVVREAFEEENIVKAPPEFAGWMIKKGFSDYWSDKYWTAHFLPIPLAQAYDNLRRGYHDKAWFEDVLRIADVHPRWREDIYNVAFQPPSIREMGYGYDTGAFTREDIIKYRRWGGLSPEDAAKTAQSLIDYRLDAERSALRTGYMNEYVNNLIDVATFRAKLIELRTNPQAIELWIQRAGVLITLKSTDTSVTEPKNITRSDVQWLYEHDLRNEAWFKVTLKNMGYTDVSAQNYLDISNQKIADKNAPVPAPSGKELTLAQVTDLYYQKAINITQLTERLTLLGYTSTAIVDLIKIIIANTPEVKIIAPKELSISQLTQLYQSNIIDEDALLIRLQTIGYTKNDAQALVTQMLKDLSLSQLSKLYYTEEIDYKTLLTRTIALGYTVDDAISLIKLMQYNAPVQKDAPTITLADINNLYSYAYFDEQQLIEQYEMRGYSHNDAILKAYLVVLGVKIPLYKAEYSNAWINESDLYYALLDISLPFITLGIPEKRVNEIMLTIVKNTQVQRTVTEKNLTKAEIIKGAKNNVITSAQAAQLLEDIGYSEDEAYYILAIEKIVSVGDPKGYWDMKQTTELYKKAQGLPYITVPNELITLEAQLKDLKIQLAVIKADTTKANETGALLVKIAQVESIMDTIKAKLGILTAT